MSIQTSSTTGHFDETVTYNANGSITSLQRNGMKNNGTFGAIDNLTITYNGNQLVKVTDAAEALNYSDALDFHDGDDTACEYDYDNNGALTRDSNRGIKSIAYDYAHYPSYINMSIGKKIRYVDNDYTPDGRKLSSKHKTYPSGNISVTTTDLYIDGLMLRNDAPLMWRFDGGYVDLNANGTPTRWNYYITDHLGSTRMVVDSNDSIRENINYYPFGSEMRISNPALMSGDTSDPFRFTGKELDRQNTLNMYDFGARLFDVAGVPMWTSVDPLCEKYYHITPYSYCAGNPVCFIDEHGDSIAILNMGYSPANQHIALLIQNEKNEWQYYSFNGVPIYNMTNGLAGGGPHDNLGEKSFTSPQMFLDSEYNTYEGHPKEKMSRNEINGYGYGEAYVLPTTMDQDNKIRESFVNSVKKGYSLFTNHCGHAVQNALKSVGIGVFISSFDKESLSYKKKTPYLPGNAFMYIKACNAGESLFKRK